VTDDTDRAGQSAAAAPITELLAAARSGEGAAAARLCEFLYDDLRKMAHARLRSQSALTLLDTTALVHESFLRLSKVGSLALADRNHFLAYAATAMRSVIIDIVRRKHTERCGGDLAHVTLDTDIADSLSASEDDVIRISEALDELGQVAPRAVRVVEMRYFAGMAEREIATALGVTERTVRRDWEKAKLLLHAALR
jgi:RNA polymerase sigma factor (TIGR02999 family)